MNYAKVVCVLLCVTGVLVWRASHVFALGISVIPSEVSVQTQVLQPAYKTLVVKNPSSEAAIFDFFVDDFEDAIRVRPKNIILESGQEKRIAIEMLPLQEGVFVTDISIVARSLSFQSFKPGAGLKVPITLTVTAQKNNHLAWVWWVIFLDAVLGVLFIAGVWIVWRKKITHKQ
ncbi:MAG: hypothetical protein A3H59_01365 [Candidatus Jacksonbacteria bacterium RIFCSPLOWO2_02_FULL_43_9]|nr:MAG: hypothetical protein UV70_C0009G0030 [Parcubacteria group bacterium GW2011_GWA2_43_13]OGY69962.1 MAG: hypothetical protein A3B94_00905 [Candidatus Jacksonbacteria bacterium RIFCSPHIGHO2_02_FULL_43_10]OGY70814.1 MAG: hypothetical protein A2986_00500 [Candidatus Jacksonbacteria bacterium RIFCSPLOWO2_01_FULL_44_13]OGY73556.1 MAG: hypothetical protein A3H59_01365 [Candidatus Jacksonbacteria bacterium RIFCSPLOWO2_02_FULL_43_9]HAZ17105.1 hypothetical protein [Candidatus Jacksonbacteria bacter